MSGASGSKFATQKENKQSKKYIPPPPPIAVPVPIPKILCCICGENNGIKMKCGHFICPGDLLNNTWAQINSNKHKISCAQCTAIIDLSELFQFVNVNEEEKKSMTKAISNNLSISEGKIPCPSCGNYCQRQNVCLSQVNCYSCHIMNDKPYTFCWYCSGKWKDLSDYRACGNDNCSRIKLNEITNPPMTYFTLADKTRITVPQIRICPNCSTFIELISGCSQMVCRICSYQFCFICLRKLAYNGGSCRTTTYNNSITCTPAPIQQI